MEQSQIQTAYGVCIPKTFCVRAADEEGSAGRCCTAAWLRQPGRRPCAEHRALSAGCSTGARAKTLEPRHLASSRSSDDLRRWRRLVGARARRNFRGPRSGRSDALWRDVMQQPDAMSATLAFNNFRLSSPARLSNTSIWLSPSVSCPKVDRRD